MAESFSRVGLAVIGSLALVLVLLNVIFWWRFVAATDLGLHLIDGTCELTSEEFTRPVWPLKMGWSFPMTGPSWTDVPCQVQLKAEGEDTEVKGSTILHFTYWQGMVWEYLKDSCSHLVPKLKGEKFDCAFAKDGSGGFWAAYVGHFEELPHLPRLLLMKACGLSFLTLGPFLLICGKTLQGASAATARENEDEHMEYQKMMVEPDGI
ncbi:unnamed protein product [Effrenium voratum]|uniref:Uncharacterized protein n=1 Tax=Effrenium voratum TaxID=2562239 RepID=A0AA36MK74_9DINO|nr:unnamed protein product [Effrenium voratum]CAJ1443378.1 unnamed protein product [Effrenium voratum]